MEMIGGVLVEHGGTHTVRYVVEQTIEETLEMGGIVLFIYALADYIATVLGGLAVRVVGRRRDD
jgi:hypothetical protein